MTFAEFNALIGVDTLRRAGGAIRRAVNRRKRVRPIILAPAVILSAAKDLAGYYRLRRRSIAARRHDGFDVGRARAVSGDVLDGVIQIPALPPNQVGDGHAGRATRCRCCSGRKPVWPPRSNSSSAVTQESFFFEVQPVEVPDGNPPHFDPQLPATAPRSGPNPSPSSRNHGPFAEFKIAVTP